MIYLFDDYVEKYQNTFSYIIGRAIEEKYSFEYIERAIAYSTMCFEMEHSNITTIAFSSSEKIYLNIFPLIDNDIDIDIYGPYGWLGYTYIRLFIDLKITFEMLFYLFPIEDALYSYHLYHEMDYSKTLAYVKSKVVYSHLDIIMKNKKMSNNALSSLSDVSASTINFLRYNKRKFDKLEVGIAAKIANALQVKIESLLNELPLKLSD